MAEKMKFAFYLTPEKKEELEQRYREDGSRSQTQFVERAVDFYLDYLRLKNMGAVLPTAVKSVIDGRLGVFENRMASLLYKLAVEVGMATRGIAENVELDDEYLRELRARSINDVKRTNGQLRFEQLAREAGEI